MAPKLTGFCFVSRTPFRDTGVAPSACGAARDLELANRSTLDASHTTTKFKDPIKC